MLLANVSTFPLHHPWFTSYCDSNMVDVYMYCYRLTIYASNYSNRFCFRMDCPLCVWIFTPRQNYFCKNNINRYGFCIQYTCLFIFYTNPTLGDEELKWNKGYDQLNHYCDVKCSEAGSFKYTFYSENE